ncbi:hypothetical protein BN1183_AA_01240 [Pantoea ananatis]|nr:hypothetical protein BN1183_AA_01240 [Pantoea ananatis]
MSKVIHHHVLLFRRADAVGFLMNELKTRANVFILFQPIRNVTALYVASRFR